MQRPGPIFLMTDFGLEDVYVGVMKAVIASSSQASIFDLTHAIKPQNVGQASYLLWTAYSYLPEGSIILCVVDPGVGTARTPIAVQTARHFFVGPDNGWLSHILRDSLGREIDGSAAEIPDGWLVVALENQQHRQPVVSQTFHGRDIFAPAVAALAHGVAIEELGPGLSDLITVPVPAPQREEDGKVGGSVIHVDHFGNLITDIPFGLLPQTFAVAIGGGFVDGPAASYQTGAPLIALVGSSGQLEIAAPNGSAARLMQVGVGAPVAVLPRPTDGQGKTQ